DIFFTALGEKIEALEDVGVQHPLSAKIAVAQAKRYLAQPSGMIKLHDLMVEETSRLCAALISGNLKIDAIPNWQTYLKRLEDYQRCAESLVRLMACGAYW